MAHDLACELLSGPNLPCYHFDPSRVDLVRELEDLTDASIARPLVEYSRDNPGEPPSSIIIAGDVDLNIEEEQIEQMLDAISTLKWLETKVRNGAQIHIQRDSDGRTLLVVDREIFTGEDLEEVLTEAEGDGGQIKESDDDEE